MLPVIPNYTVTEILYAGQRTLVCRAISQKDKIKLVIKMNKEERPTEKSLAQLKHEYEVMKKIDSPYVLKTLGFETIRTRGLLLLEDFQGQALSNLLCTDVVQLESFFPIAIAAAEGLGEIHHQQIIHKDIKPHNIIVNTQTNQIKITDFGISSLLSRKVQQLSRTENLEGTLAYISPEQTGRINNPVGYRSDIYSLGITFYQMLSGHVPFESSEFIELLHDHLTKSPIPLKEINSNIPSALSDIIDKCLAKNADDRYHSAFGLKNDLNECYQHWINHNHTFTKEFLANFVPGIHDVYDQFELPQKLYGRDNELSLLRNLFNKVREGYAEIALIKGSMGIGKSSIVDELKNYIFQNKGYFIAGKCEEFKKNIPYYAFIQALQDLISQILSESKESLQQWRHLLQEGLGKNGQVIVDIIPDLELIIGEQLSLANLEPRDAENRFKNVFRDFIEALLKQKHPIVIFIDDMQWIDPSTLKLLDYLLLNSELKRILLLGAYRDSDESALILLNDFVERLNKIKKNITYLDVQSLPLIAILDLIRDTFHSTEEKIKPLAELVYQKTQGNPFFVTQFLKELYQENFLNFNVSTQSWEGNLEKIQAMQVTDNVAELISKRIRNLPLDVQNLLKTASVIGTTFDIKILAIVEKTTIENVALSLGSALTAEIIVPQDEQDDQDGTVGAGNINLITINGIDLATTRYVFQHDRIAQVAYQLLSENDRIWRHLKVGRALLQQESYKDDPKMLMSIVNHLNLGIPLIEERNERLKIAQLNLKVAQLAQVGFAYDAMEQYAICGIRALDDNCWKDNYQTAFLLHLLYAVSSLLTNHAEQGEITFDNLLRHAQSKDDKGKIYYYKMINAMSFGRTQRAIAFGIEALKVQGISISYPIKTREWILKKIHFAFLTLFNPLENILSLPLTKDKNVTLLASIYRILSFAAFEKTDPVLDVVLINGLELTLKKGISEDSGSALMRYIIFMHIPNITKKWRQLFTYGHIACRLADYFPKTHSYYNAYVAYASFVMPWKISYQDLMYYFEGLIEEFYEAGVSLPYANGLLFQVFYGFMGGIPIPVLQGICTKDYEKCQKMGLQIVFTRFSIFRDLLLGLLDLRKEYTDPLSKELIQLLKLKEISDKESYSFFWYYVLRFFLCYLFEKHEGCFEMIEKLNSLRHRYSSVHIWQFFYFYEALFLADLNAKGKLTRQDNKKLHQYLDLLSQYSKICPQNFENKYFLLTAELSKATTDHKRTVALYEKAISSAIENKLIHEEALACELLAKYYLQQNMKKIASYFFIEAYNAYTNWGAIAKLRILREQYLPLLSLPFISSRVLTEKTLTKTIEFLTQRTHSLLTTTAPGNVFDETVIIQAAQMLSEERNLNQLLSKLIRIAMIQAGADKVVLLLKEGEEFFIHGEILLGQKETHPEKKNLQEGEESLSLSAINYVTRKKQMLIVPDAMKEGHFQHDKYIQKNKVVSLLCIPLIRHNKMNGILYFENKRTKEVFTQKKMNILQFLSSQIAISLENALFYADLESKVEERTQALQMTLKQLLQREKAASVGTLAAGIAHELEKPLALMEEGSMKNTLYVQPLANLVKKMKDDNNKTECLDCISVLTSNLTEINNQAKRARTIIVKMLEHSQKEKQKKTQINPQILIEECQQETWLIFQRKHPSFTITFENHFDNTVGEIYAMEDGLRLVFKHLMTNAYESMWEKNAIEQMKAPTLTVKTKRIGKQVEISIRDNGIGIPKSSVDKIFNPLFTTKPAGQGSGFGLSLSYSIIVQQHGGSLTFHTKEGEFAEFIILLPLSMDI